MIHIVVNAAHRLAQVADQLVAKKIEIHPVRRAPAFRATYDSAIKSARGFQVVHNNGQVKWAIGFHLRHLVLRYTVRQKKRQATGGDHYADFDHEPERVPANSDAAMKRPEFTSRLTTLLAMAAFAV
ncbi:MAG: hypothetical protein R3212_07730, partial [Xanthomonadales bacterium]|nr:hypothetical protein [Xanthomonadales bacterium]